MFVFFFVSSGYELLPKYLLGASLHGVTRRVILSTVTEAKILKLCQVFDSSSAKKEKKNCPTLDFLFNHRLQ